MLKTPIINAIFPTSTYGEVREVWGNHVFTDDMFYNNTYLTGNNNFTALLSTYRCTRTGIGVQAYRCTGVQVYRRTGVQAYRRTGVQVYRCTGVQAYRRTGVQVYMYRPRSGLCRKFSSKNELHLQLKELAILATERKTL
jgi:hypothetical protein